MTSFHRLYAKSADGISQNIHETKSEIPAQSLLPLKSFKETLEIPSSESVK